MSRVRAVQLLKTEEVPKEHQGWIGKLIGPINQYITQSIAILNGGILFSDNVTGVDFTYSFTYVSNASSFPVGFAWPLSMRPQALSVVSASEDGTPFIAAAAWTYSANNLVQLTSVLRLTSAPSVALLQNGKAYKIRVRVTP